MSFFVGLLEVHGTTSYSSQEPWLFPATIRQNILFGEDYDQDRYDEIVRVCALPYDFSLLENGDLTLVSDRGMNLSKGQQARINLARAIYRRANIYLLDDPLTALDNQVQDHIFRHCIMGFLKDQICIMVSQNPLHIEAANQVVILREGNTVFSGDTSGADKEIIDVITAKIEQDSKDEPSDFIPEEMSSLISPEEQESNKNVYKEVKKVGKVRLNVYHKYFQYGGGLIIFFLVMAVYIGTQLFESLSEQELTQW